MRPQQQYRRAASRVVIGLLLLSIYGCKKLPMPEGGEKLYGTAYELVQNGLDRLKRKQHGEAQRDFVNALIKMKEAEGKQANKESWLNVRIQELSADLDKQTAQYRGAFLTMGIASAVFSMVGLFLWVSGVLAAYPKAGIAAIAAGFLGVGYSFIAPELQRQSPYLIFGIYTCLLLLAAFGLTFIGVHLWRSLKRGAKVFHREKMGEGEDRALTITEIAEIEMDDGQVKVFDAARRQLRAAGETPGDVIGDEHGLLPPKKLEARTQAMRDALKPGKTDIRLERAGARAETVAASARETVVAAEQTEKLAEGGPG